MHYVCDLSHYHFTELAENIAAVAPFSYQPWLLERVVVSQSLQRDFTKLEGSL